MPILDDQLLDSLLHEAGDSFGVPPSGAADILERINAGSGEGDVGSEGDCESSTAGPEPADAARIVQVSRTIRSGISSHRVLTVAASLILVVVVAGAALLFGSTSPSKPGNFFGNASPPTTTPAPAAKSTRAGAGVTNAGPAGTASGAPSNSKAYGVAAAPSSSASRQAASSALPSTVGQAARIEQTGSLDIEVARGALSSTVTRLTTLATTYGGFVANEQTNSGASSDQGPSGTVTLQIPVANFSAALKEVESFGKVSQLTTKATDVTAQYVDLQSQITALEASRQQYLTIMTKASSIGDILSVQAQLNTLQTQIQQLQGQLNVLGSETDYSTLTTQLSEPGSPTPHHHRRRAAAPSGLSKAWHDSLHGFAAGVEGLVRVAGPALFALLCLAALVLGGQLSWRRLQRHNL